MRTISIRRRWHGDKIVFAQMLRVTGGIDQAFFLRDEVVCVGSGTWNLTDLVKERTVATKCRPV